MLRILRILFLALVGLVLVVMALANRAPVTLRLLPDELAALWPLPDRWEVPLFVVILASVLAGLTIGFVLEWFREHRHRAEAARRKRELQALEREVRGLRERTGEGKDDILALLD